jgi:WD40 repeat protein
LREGQDGSAAARERDQETGPAIPPAPKQVEDYEILAEVGRGGMGVVYRARHRGLRRLAALKMVLAGEFASPGQATRFRLEAELAARVQHPNIVQVYEVSSHEGRPFLAMEWADGGSLADRLDGTPWPAHPAARLIETLARAVHEAHEHGVVHRDLKPANILMASGGHAPPGESSATAGSRDPLAGWTPKITDFGLAQPTEGGQTLTRSGFLVGTPGYMAPEQAGGKRALVGPATDIYGLGVVLYQLITGQLPFRGDSTLEVLRAVTDDEAVRPRRLQPGIPRDLEAITLHCLEKEPSRRYPSARALAEDLRHFLEGKPITARPVGTAARLLRWCRRKPWIATLLLLLAASLVGGFLGVTWKWLEADEQRHRAEHLAQQANDEKHAALWQAYRARLSAAAAALQNHDVDDAARQLEDAPNELRDWEWRHLHSRLDDRSGRIVAEPGATLLVLPLPDRLQVGQVSPKNGLRLTDLDGQRPRTISFEARMEMRSHILPTRDGLRFVEWVKNKTMCLWDEAGKLRLSKDVPFFGAARLSPDGSRLALTQDQFGRSGFALYETATGQRTAVCTAHSGEVWALTFSPDGTRIACVGEDGLACIWDAATGAKIAECRGHTSKVLRVAFRPDGARLATTSADGSVRQWDAATGGQAEPPFDRHIGEVLSVAYSPDGKWIASGGTDHTVRLWRATGREEIAVLHGHTGAVYEVAFTPDGRRVVSVSQRQGHSWAGDDTLGVWEVDARAGLPVLRGHTSYVYPVAFSPDGRRIASGSWDRTLRLWDARTGEARAVLDNGDLVKTLAFSPDGSEVVTARKEGLQVWDVASGRRLREIPSPTPSIQAVAFHPDGVTVAALDGSKGGIIFNAATGKVVARLRLGASHDTNALAYSPDGRWLAGVSADQKTVCLFDARTHELSGQFSGHEDTIRFVTFSADSRRLASCGADRNVRVWQIDDGKCQVLRGHTDEVFAVAFHPEGKRLATGGRDRAVWFWDLATGEEVVRLQGHTSYIWSLAFSPDGKTLVSGSGDGTVRLWDTEPLTWRRQARREGKAVRAPLHGGEQARP